MIISYEGKMRKKQKETVVPLGERKSTSVMQQRQSNAKDGTGFLRALGPLSWSAPTWAHQ